MPQLEQIWSYPSQIFWLFVTFGLLYLLCWKVLLPGIEKILNERQERIDADIRRAAELKEQAEKTLADYEIAVAKANAEAQAVLRQTAADISEESAKAGQALADQLSKRADEATKRIETAKNEAMTNIWPTVSETAVAASERLMGKSLTAKDVKSVVDGLKKGAA
ncbi:MAG: ATPase [Alphaproteobacteria bacterium]